MTTIISAGEAKRRIHAKGEIALIDVREAGQFGEGHMLFAVPCPYSRLEIDFPRLVPRTSTSIVLVDDGDGVAERAACRLQAIGYGDVAVVDGGVAGWANAGYAIYKGVNVPSKLLGELVEHALEPQRITAATLAEWTSAGKRFRFFDTRPPAEYAKMRVPGSACLPNGELAHRIAAAVPDPDETVLITCAGRTRGLIGAAGLKLAGVPNPVFALENGTQGWALAGFELERGNTAAPYPKLNKEQQDDSARRGRAICERAGIRMIDAGEVARMLADGQRTTHVLDVRSHDEVREQPIKAAPHALSGQLIQSTDQWIGTRRSRVVLIDDTGLRAGLAAHWLKCLGYETHVHRIEPETELLVPVIPHAAPIAQLPSIAARDAAEIVGQGAGVLVDLRTSGSFRKAHAKGACWSIRPLLDHLAGVAGKRVFLFADEPDVAALAAVDLGAAGAAEVLFVHAGLTGWQQAGLDIVQGDASPTSSEAIDFLIFVHDRHDGNLESSRRYLEWEQGLMAQTDEAERAEFLI